MVERRWIGQVLRPMTGYHDRHDLASARLDIAATCLGVALGEGHDDGVVAVSPLRARHDLPGHLFDVTVPRSDKLVVVGLVEVV